MLRILFVCMGNICRSPTAEVVTRAIAHRAGISDQIEVDSAGTHTANEGEPVDPRARKAAGGRGYDLSKGRARRVKDRDFVRFDRIIAMDQQNLAFLRRSCPPEYEYKLALFLDYATELAGRDVPDPYYGGPAGFDKVIDLCEFAAQGLVAKIAANRGSV